MFEEIKLDPNNFRFSSQLRLILIGASQSGKTSWIRQFLKWRHQLCVKPYSLIIYASPNLATSNLRHEHDFIDSFRELCAPTECQFLSQLPDLETISEYINQPDGKVCFIADDFHSQLWHSSTLADMFVRLSSHMGLDCIISSHQGFGKGPYYSTIFKSANAIVLFNCLSDQTLNTMLGRKLFPGKKNFINLCFEKVFRLCGPYGYLFFSFDNQQPINHIFSIRSRMFPFKDDDGKEKYLPIFFAWKDG